MAGKLNKELQEAKRLLAELEKSYKSIGEKNPFKDVKAANANIAELNEGLKDANDNLRLINSDASGLVSSFKAITEEVSTTNKAYSNSSKSLNSLTSIAGKLRDHQHGINTLSSSQLKTLQSKIESEKANLESNITQLKVKTGIAKEDEKNASMLANINGLLNEKNSALKSIAATTSKEAKERKEVEKSLGITGGVLKGLSKIPIIGDVVDTNEALKEAEATVTKTGSGIRGMGAAFKNLGGQLKSGLLNPSNMFLGALTFIISAIKDMDKGAGEFAKGMNVSYSEALKTREEMASLATASGDAALNANNLLKTTMAVGQSLGTNAKINEADAKTMTKLVQQSGFQHDELMNIQKLSLVNGKTLEDNTKEILGGASAYAARNGIVVNEKDVLREVNKSSKALQLSLGQNTQAIAESVVKAKQFGLNLEQAGQMAEKLLDFESSIESELSAELLTGKNLNLERARQLSLEGDIAGAAAEVASQIGSAAEFGEMNVIQQQAMADAVGLSREALAASLIEREALAAIGVEDAEAARNKYDSLVSQFGVEEAQKRLGDEQLALQFEQQSNAEKFTQAIQKIKDIFVSMMDGPIESILEAFSTLLSYSSILYGTVGLIAGVFAGKMIGGIVQTIAKMVVLFTTSAATAAATTATATAISFGAMIPVILGAVAAIGGAIYGFSKMSDGVIGPGGETIVSGPKGSIQIDKEDSMIVGTDLGGKKKPKSPTKDSGGSVNVDMTQTNALLQQLISVIQTGGSVTLDGQKVGEALKLGSFQTQ